MDAKELSEQEIKPVAYLINWWPDKVRPTGNVLSFYPATNPENISHALYRESTVTALRAEIERLKKHPPMPWDLGYQTIFNAIGDAVHREGVGIAISVQKFCDAIRKAIPQSSQEEPAQINKRTDEVDRVLSAIIDYASNSICLLDKEKREQWLQFEALSVNEAARDAYQDIENMASEMRRTRESIALDEQARAQLERGGK